MHSDHDVFTQGIEQKRRIKMTFSDRKNLQNLLRQCAPLHYSKGQVEGDGLDCYYFWDFEAAEGGHFLAAPPSQIIEMELADGTFKIEDLSNFRRTTAGLAKGSAT